MNRSKLVIVAAAAVGTLGVAHAQLVQIGAMTQPNTVLDFDLMPAGATTVAAINAAFPVANIGNITLTPPTAAAGVYNTNPNGRALGGDPNGSLGLFLMDPPTGDFGAFAEMIIDLGQQSTEFGSAVSDWNGPINVRAYDNNVLLGEIAVDATGGLDFYVQWQGAGSFDRIEMSTNPQFTTGNWVATQLTVEGVPEPGTFIAIGAGLALLALRRRK